jgi:hypothetical protein
MARTEYCVMHDATQPRIGTIITTVKQKTHRLNSTPHSEDAESTEETIVIIAQTKYAIKRLRSAQTQHTAAKMLMLAGPMSSPSGPSPRISLKGSFVEDPRSVWPAIGI